MSEQPARPENQGGLEGLARERTATTQVPEPARRLGSRVVLPVVLLTAVAGLLVVAGRDALGSRRNVTVVPVVVRADAAAPGESSGNGAVVATAAGWVEPAPFEVHVSTLTDGIVAEMLVLDGDTVEAGQILARLVSEDAEIALAEATAANGLAEARVAAARARLAAATADWAEPVALERAVEVAEAEKARAAAARVHLGRREDAARARLDEAQDRLRRENELIATGAVSDAELAATRLRVATLAADLAAVHAEDALLRADESAADARLRAARRDLDLRVRDRLARDVAIADVADAEAGRDAATAGVRAAQLRLDRTEIRAPIAGVVMRRRAEPGRRVMLNMDMESASWIADLYDPDHLQVRVDVPLADAGAVGVGSRARILVETLPDRTFTGEITHIVNFADIQKNTVQFKVRIDAPDPLLRPEMLARVEILGASDGGAESGASAARGTLYAPKDLVAGGRAWVVGAGGEALELRSVRVGTEHRDGWVAVRDGLQPGDRLVVDPPADLVVGERVRVTGEAPR